jgi:hypothetical protein
LWIDDVTEVHVSVAFTWDIPRAEWLMKQWESIGVPVKIGGPAFDNPGGDFVPGRYLKPGYVITSRGCPNQCWFCAVPRREGQLRELPITDGYNVLDDNLLACSGQHICAVFDMLKRQSEKPLFTGGLEAKRLRTWHVDLFRESKAKRMYFAYDTPDDHESLIEAGKLLRTGGITQASHIARAYVLIGYPGDTITEAEKRLNQTWAAGFVPYAMLYQGKQQNKPENWKKFQREWLRPKLVTQKI